MCVGGHFGAADADVVRVDAAQAKAALVCGCGDLVGPAGRVHRDRVEVVPVHDPVARGTQAGGEVLGVPVDALGDLDESSRAVVDGVHRGDHGEQHLRRADVGGRLVAADVLLARLERQSVRRAAGTVHGHTDEAAREVTLEAGAHRHEPCVRPAVEEGYAEALRGSDSYVRSELAGGDQQGQRQQVGRDGHEGTAFVGLSDDRRQIADLPEQPGYEATSPENSPCLGQRAVQVDDDHLDPDRPGTRAHHVEGLRKGVSVDEDPVRLRRERAA